WPRKLPTHPPRCHLQMSPFSMSWMCCTMRLMATGERWVICEELTLNKLKTNVFREKKAHDRAVFLCSINRLVV
uniref:Uncharacterized protein n=1 Tax=Sparus aurata TaxID=8175 RepID=A0A671W5A7_SPAAU